MGSIESAIKNKSEYLEKSKKLLKHYASVESSIDKRKNFLTEKLKRKDIPEYKINFMFYVILCLNLIYLVSFTETFGVPHIIIAFSNVLSILILLLYIDKVSEEYAIVKTKEDGIVDFLKQQMEMVEKESHLGDKYFYFEFNSHMQMYESKRIESVLLRSNWAVLNIFLMAIITLWLLSNVVMLLMGSQNWIIPMLVLSIGYIISVMYILIKIASCKKDYQLSKCMMNINLKLAKGCSVLNATERENKSD